MKSVRINMGKGYDVVVGQGLIRSIGKLTRSVPAVSESSRVVLVSDKNTSEMYSDQVIMSLKLAGYSVTLFTTKPTEKTRRLDTVSELCSVAANAGLRSGDFFIALGGTIVCDIAGIAASLYLGGSPLVLVPTTTLGFILRSVGGMYNADLSEGRRLLGTHWLPSAVICDTDTIDSLSEHTKKNGLVELIMMACVSSDKLLDDIPDLNNKESAERVITKVITLRAKMIGKDDRIASNLQMLKFGDLMCRAIEEVSDYSIYHGEALSIGMALTSAAGERAGLTQVGTTDRLEAILKSYDLPITTNIPSERLLKAISEDRRLNASSINLPLIKTIGSGFIHKINTVDLRGFFIQSLPDWAK